MATELRYWVYSVKVPRTPWYRVTDTFAAETPQGFFHVIQYGNVKELAVLSLRKPRLGSFFNPARELWAVLEPGYKAFKAEQDSKARYLAFLAVMRSEKEAFVIGRRIGKTSALGCAYRDG